MSLGEKLRSAREGKGLTINDVARVTFIRAHYLESIERDDFSAIPPSRIRYFVQDYAKSVDLDPAKILEELPDISVSSPVPVATPPARSVPVPVPQAVHTPEVRREFSDDTEEIAPPPPTSQRPLRRRRPRYTPLDQGNPALVRGLMTVALLLLVGLGIYYMMGGFDSDDTVAASTESGDTTAGENDVRILSNPDTGVNTTDTTGTPAATGDSLTLQGRATDRVWYSIKMDNRQETGELDSGDVKVWKAEKEFRVSLGNAGGLEFTLNGKSLGTLGRKGVSLRPKTIDAQGVRETSVTRPRSTTSTPRARASRRGTQQNTESPRLRNLETTQPRRAVDPDQ